MWKAATALALASALGGCASLNQLTSAVSTYSVWPAERRPSTYVFERLPSQQANPQQQQVLEDAATRAMQLAGFTPVTDPGAADVTVTLGARVYASQVSPYDDPYWWRGGLWGHRHFFCCGYGGFGRPFGPWGSPWSYPWGYPWGYPYYSYTTTYEREVALVIRDRRTGQALYESRVTNDGYSPSIMSLLAAMFEAGLKDFPQGGVNQRRVTTQISS